MSIIKIENDLNLFYKDYGSGKPVIFVHGWCINSDSWEYLMDDICKAGFRCICYDQRGCGRSDQPWDGFDSRTLAADLAGIIEQLDLKELILIGHSTGCALITQYMADYGENRVKKAVYIGTISPTPNPDQHLNQSLIEIIKADRPAYVKSLADDFFNLSGEGNTVSQEMTEWTIDIVLQASLRAAVEMTKIYFNNDQSDFLKKIHIPVLLQHGDKDINAPLENTARPTHQLLKNSELKVYAGQPHGMYITKATMLSQDIVAFISKP
jgi:non-heme chloroperoxidase